MHTGTDPIIAGTYRGMHMPTGTDPHYRGDRPHYRLQISSKKKTLRFYSEGFCLWKILNFKFVDFLSDFHDVFGH